VFKDRKFYPDANSTLRVTYGKVNSYAPRDAVKYEFQTYLDGVMEKYIPGNYEFDLPPKLIELYEKKDFGPYARMEKYLLHS
ncbi:MAG: S46 family peptidase, partial [Saprospiraceae bacterium]